jgi:hypothetical protein
MIPVVNGKGLVLLRTREATSPYGAAIHSNRIHSTDLENPQNRHMPVGVHQLRTIKRSSSFFYLARRGWNGDV